MYTERNRQSGPLIALVISVLVCLLMLAACNDGGSPSSDQSGVATTPGADVGMSESEEIRNMLTEVSNLPTTTPIPSPMGMTAVDTLSIYLAAIDALLGEKEPAVIYVGPYIGEGEQLDDFNNSRLLPDGLLDALSKSETGPHYELLAFEDAVEPLENGGAVKNSGVFITLGAIANDPTDKTVVVVRGSLYRSLVDAQGSRFRFKPDPTASGSWKLLDSTQEWIR